MERAGEREIKKTLFCSRETKTIKIQKMLVSMRRPDTSFLLNECISWCVVILFLVYYIFHDRLDARHLISPPTLVPRP